MTDNSLLSVVVPVFNEGSGLLAFHKKLVSVLVRCGIDYEIIYVDDGSQDETSDVIKKLHSQNRKIKLVRLARNFGKESALAAGIEEAEGHAIITIDGDGQHPVELITQFIEAWQQGAQVVVGVRSDLQPGFNKKLSSYLFYKLFNRLADQPLIPGATDYRLMDREVQQAFLKLRETERITRGLVDWLGYDRQLIYFQTQRRLAGNASYNRRKLFKLAANSFVSLTPRPLYLFGYLGIFITIAALTLGLAVIIEQIILDDPWHWRFTGTAMVSILILFLVGVLLVAQGMLSLYITHIHSQTKRRPLYVINQARSVGLSHDHDTP